jgi:hypothetical protein
MSDTTTADTSATETTSKPTFDPTPWLARELGLPERGVRAVVENATVPFIARYRKEVTGGLDEVQLRDMRERAEYLKEMEERRAAILKSIEEQGKLTTSSRRRSSRPTRSRRSRISTSPTSPSAAPAR